MAELRRNPGPTGRPSTWSLLLLVVTPLVLLANSCTRVSSSRPGLTESGKFIDAIVSTLGESSLTLSFHETPSEIAVTNIYQSPDRLLTLERPDRRVIIGNNEYCSNTNGRNWSEVHLADGKSKVRSAIADDWESIAKIANVRELRGTFYVKETVVSGGHRGEWTADVQVQGRDLRQVTITVSSTNLLLRSYYSFSRVGTSPPVTAPPAALISKGSRFGPC